MLTGRQVVDERMDRAARPFAERADPVVTYEFTDTSRLHSYLAGQLGRNAFAETVAVRYIDPSARETDPLAKFGDLDKAQQALNALAQLQ